jgi:1-acyl-sn-glycerol-3-phosphate acyltransferase
VLTGARRVLTTSLMAALIPVAAALLVCAAVLTCPVSLRPHGRWRAVRLCAFALVYLSVDVAGVLAAGAVALRPGHADRAAYPELTRLLGVLRRAAVRMFGLRVEVTPAVREAVGDGARPLLVLGRHAGLGDSFLLVHTLLADARLRPRIVLKRVLRLDPCLDILVGRLPHCFVPAPRGTTAEQQIALLAAELRPGDALVLFPEGGNFTRRRRDRAVAALRRLGRDGIAERAERMTHVLAPRTTGVLAVLDAAPTADVVFVAHTGLDRIHSMRTGWAELPLRGRVRAHWWRVPSGEVPRGDAARSDWLLAQWGRVDDWIGAHGEH